MLAELRDYVSANKAAGEYVVFNAVVLSGMVGKNSRRRACPGGERDVGIEATYMRRPIHHIPVSGQALYSDEGFPYGFTDEIKKQVGENGILYGVFELLFSIGLGRSVSQAETSRGRSVKLRIIEHWDNINGTIERGYAGNSIFFKDDDSVKDYDRIRDYARLLASVSVNGISINNVNVHKLETLLITEKYLLKIAELAEIFRDYGIKLFLSINFAAPVEIGGLDTADPLDGRVVRWWEETAARIYSYIPDFGGFLVKADLKTGLVLLPTGGSCPGRQYAGKAPDLMAVW